MLRGVYDGITLGGINYRNVWIKIWDVTYWSKRLIWDRRGWADGNDKNKTFKKQIEKYLIVMLRALRVNIGVTGCLWWNYSRGNNYRNVWIKIWDVTYWSKRLIIWDRRGWGDGNDKNKTLIYIHWHFNFMNHTNCTMWYNDKLYLQWSRIWKEKQTFNT